MKYGTASLVATCRQCSIGLPADDVSEATNGTKYSCRSSLSCNPWLRTIRLSVIRQPCGESIIRPIAILTSTASRGVGGVLRKIHPTSDVLSFRLAQNVTLSAKRRPRGGDEVQ